eukprot:3587251-Pleurochrysis_carterae.AAC.1
MSKQRASPLALRTVAAAARTALKSAASGAFTPTPSKKAHAARSGHGGRLLSPWRRYDEAYG